MTVAKKKILFIGPHRPNRNGSQRFRMEQYFPYLKAAGYECDYSWFIDERDDRIFYSSGHWIDKLGVFLKAIRVRLADIMFSNRYDVIFVQREAFMTGTAFFERQFRRSRARLIFDFDDAIWLEDVSAQNQALRWMKRPGKTADIIRMADAVIAGNTYLAAFAGQFNRNVHIIPTVVDTEVFAPALRSTDENQSICIGWSGSKTTVKHFTTVLPALKKIADEFGSRVKFMLVGDAAFHAEGLPLETSDFRFEHELHHFRQMDIGLMPLPDDEWSKGKCAFKAIQYMAMEIPPVASPVGMNSEVVNHGVNGFLATSTLEWVQWLSRLIQSPELRRELGKAGRKTVIENYSVHSQMNKLMNILS